MAKRPTITSIDTSLTRWKTRLKRAVTAIDKLEKQKRRLQKKTSIPASTLVAAVKGHIARVTASVSSEPKQEVFAKIVDESITPHEPVKPGIVAECPDIPDFLRRQSQPDPVAEQIREEQAATKKAKARGRIEKMKAKKAGELKKMPLTGKAALDHIRNG
jgi:hypothetical protein